jgi:hypothetical protein
VLRSKNELLKVIFWKCKWFIHLLKYIIFVTYCSLDVTETQGSGHNLKVLLVIGYLDTKIPIITGFLMLIMELPNL